MAGINVLSDTLKVGSKLEKTPTSKGKDVSDSPETAATGFAAVLSGSINLNADPKGQNSKAGQDSEKKQSTVESVKSTQNPNGSESMLGYGIFALPFLAQMLQSDLPAGKEANSGNDVSQGTGGLATANASLTNAPIVSVSNLELAMLKLFSLASDEGAAQSGMTTPKPQGDNPAITELDKYKQVIADLLVELSGGITDPSLKGNPSSSDNAGTKNLSQDIAKIVQGWMTVTDDVVENGSVTSGNITDGQVQVKGEGAVAQALHGGGATMANLVNSSFNKAFSLLAAIYPILSQGSKDAKAPQVVTGTIDAEGGVINPAANGSLEIIVNKSEKRGNDLEPVATPAKDTAFVTNAPQKSDGMVFSENKTLKIVQGTYKEEVQKGDSAQSSEPVGVKDVQNQNSSVGVGLASNILATNVADGKTVAVPVWEQVSTVLREQVMNKSQDLKQLDIQLHPADLGKIQIDVRWENGQVHLQVQASQAATGQLLQDHLSDLRQALSHQGVNCGMLQMGQGGERQQNPHGDESRRTFNQNTHLNEDEDLIPVTNPLSLGRDEINQINVTA